MFNSILQHRRWICWCSGKNLLVRGKWLPIDFNVFEFETTDLKVKGKCESHHFWKSVLFIVWITSWIITIFLQLKWLIHIWMDKIYLTKYRSPQTHTNEELVKFIRIDNLSRRNFIVRREKSYGGLSVKVVSKYRLHLLCRTVAFLSGINLSLKTPLPLSLDFLFSLTHVRFWFLSLLI